jgi:hypothetical protein
MTPLVVVTGAPGAGRSTLAAALAERLGCFPVSLDAVMEELAADAPDTPRDWLRLDAEQEVVRRLAAVDGEAVLDLQVGQRRDMERVAGLLRPWWDRLVEVRCQVPADETVPDGVRGEAGRPRPLGAPRTVVVDLSRPVALGDVVSAVRRETGTRPPPRREAR